MFDIWLEYAYKDNKYVIMFSKQNKILYQFVPILATLITFQKLNQKPCRFLPVSFYKAKAGTQKRE